MREANQYGDKKVRGDNEETANLEGLGRKITKIHCRAEGAESRKQGDREGMETGVPVPFSCDELMRGGRGKKGNCN